MLTTCASCSTFTTILRSSSSRRSFSLIKRIGTHRPRRLFDEENTERKMLEEAYARGRVNALAIIDSCKRSRNVRWFLSLSLVVCGCGFVKLFSSIVSLLSFPRPPPSSFLNILSRRDWRAPKGCKLTFDDVVGCVEAKAELQIVVRFLNTPDLFTDLGARPPRGILIVGPPGVGKTMLGRALAGEAAVQCLMADGSELGGDLSGEGARLVRDLFATARRKTGPCLVFIDGVETACPRRDGGETQTTNQLLVEMDGLRSRLADRVVVVLGTTSHEDLLDPAARRGGRFELIIKLNSPNLIERLEMFRLYTGRVKAGRIRKTIWDQVGRRSTGMTGADISNAVNRAAIKAALAGSEEVSEEDLMEAVEEVQLGLEKRLGHVSDDTKICRAVRQAGHAVLSRFTRHAPPLLKVSISGRPHGRLWLSEAEENRIRSRAELQARMDVLLGGRIAEEELLGIENVSATSQDLEKASRIAEEMVNRFGMSQILGARAIGEDVSNAVSTIVDEEISRLLRESCERARTVIRSRMREMQRVVAALEKYDSLDSEDLSAVLIGGVPKAGVEKESEAELLITRWSNF